MSSLASRSLAIGVRGYRPEVGPRKTPLQGHTPGQLLQFGVGGRDVCGRGAALSVPWMMGTEPMAEPPKA